MSTPTTPTPNAPASNQPPQIASATITPSLGVFGLTTFTAHVDARDPDADPISIAWSDASGPVGDTADLTFKAGALRAPLTVTIADGRGGIASTKVSFVAGDMNGVYDGFFGPEGRGLEYFFMRLTRTGATITGTISEYRDYQVGTVDPAEPGRIDSDGRFRIRLKFAPYGGDFVFEGQLVPYDKPLVGMFLSNYAFSGRVIGGRFTGQTVTFGEHNPY